MITTEIKLKSSTTNLVGSASCINISSTLKKKRKEKRERLIELFVGTNMYHINNNFKK